VKALADVRKMVPHPPRFEFGRGNSAEQFIKILMDEKTWLTKPQKQFVDHHFALCR